MTHKTALVGGERTGDELVVWRAAVARARGALSKTFEGKMEAALASFDVVPQHGRGAGGTPCRISPRRWGISYGALDQYRQVLRWLGDFVHVYEIPSYSLARVAQVSGRWRSGAEFARFVETQGKPHRPSLDGERAAPVPERAPGQGPPPKDAPGQLGSDGGAGNP